MSTLQVYCIKKKKKFHHFVPFSTVDYISEDEALLLFVPFRCMSAKMATMT